MDIIEFITGSSLVLIATFTPIILAIVQLAKKWISNEKWYPVISVVVGVALSLGFSNLFWSYAILLGVLSGLSASGLYSSTKTVTA